MSSPSDPPGKFAKISFIVSGVKGLQKLKGMNKGQFDNELLIVPKPPQPIAPAPPRNANPPAQNGNIRLLRIKRIRNSKAGPKANTSNAKFSPKVNVQKNIDNIKVLQNANQIQINSVNCAFAIVDNKFFKIQIKDTADPLINEVIFLKRFPKFNSKNATGLSQDIFLKYEDHFLINADSFEDVVKRQFENKLGWDLLDLVSIAPLKILATNALKNPISLGNYIDRINAIQNTSDYISACNKLVELLVPTFEQYEKFSKKTGFIHCDLHLDNIQLSQDQDKTICTIIDYGRCYRDDEIDIYNSEAQPSYKTFEKYNLQPSIATNTNNPFDHPYRLTNIIGANRPGSAIGIPIGSVPGYLCDIGQLSFNLMRERIYHMDQPWLELQTSVINRSKLLRVMHYTQLRENIVTYDVTKLNILQKGLLWYACYLNAQAYITPTASGMYNYLFSYPNKFPNRTNNSNSNSDPKKRQAEIFDYPPGASQDYIYINYTPAMYTLFFPNGMINPEYYNNAVKEKTIDIWNYVIYGIVPPSRGASGGATKKLIPSYRGGLQSTQSSKTNSMSEPTFEKNEKVDPDDEFRKYRGMSVVSILADTLADTLATNENFMLQEVNKELLQPVSGKQNTNDLFTIEVIDETPTSMKCEGTSCARNVSRIPISATQQIHSLPQQKAASGTNMRSWRVYMDKETGRKYVRKSNTRWYLDENRGKYRYIDDTHIYMLGA